MSNSNLVNYTKLSPNHSGVRSHKIDTITIHHMAGNLSVEACGNGFANPAREASSNYGIGSDGRVGLYVDERNRAWTSGNAANDHRSVTIEVANDGGDPNWHVSDKALAKLIELCVDICKRNGIEKLNFTGDKSGNLTMHKYFQPTLCPGPYLESKFPYIAEEVNKRLKEKDVLYLIQTGAFREKSNAEELVEKLNNDGYPAFIVAVVEVKQTEPVTPKKSNEEIASEVVAGKWGNNPERKERLTAAGYDYSTIQRIVSDMFKT